MEKLIYNNKTNKIIILDSDNKFIPDLILNKDIIDNIDFNNLPINVINNLPLFLGKEYSSYEFEYLY